MKDRITASAAQVDAFSLSRHNLSVRAGLAELVHVASRMCGAQAQVMSAAEMSLGARLEGATMSDVRRSLWEERTLVKTWAMRGTLHLLPAEDLSLYVLALGPYLKEGIIRWLNRRGLDLRSVSVLSDAIIEALDTGPLTRKELGASVGRTLGPIEAMKPPLFESIGGWGNSRWLEPTLIRPLKMKPAQSFSAATCGRMARLTGATIALGADCAPGRLILRGRRSRMSL